MDNIEIEIQKLTEGRQSYLANLKEVIQDSFTAIDQLYGRKLITIFKENKGNEDIDPALSIFYLNILRYALTCGIKYVLRNNPQTLDSNNSYPNLSREDIVKSISSKSFYTRRRLATMMIERGANTTMVENAIVELSNDEFSAIYETPEFELIKVFLREELVEESLWENARHILTHEGDSKTKIDNIQTMYYSLGAELDISALCLLALNTTKNEDEQTWLLETIFKNGDNDYSRLSKIKDVVSKFDPDEKKVFSHYTNSTVFDKIMITFRVVNTLVNDGKYGAYKFMKDIVEQESVENNKAYNLEHGTEYKKYIIKKHIAQLERSEIPENGTELYNECAQLIDSEDSWLPVYFFSDFNQPDFNKNNWIRGILSEVERGASSKNEEGEGNGRLKLAQVINVCARLGIISDDEQSKLRMAYILTGRNVGFAINEDKPLSVRPESLPFLCYIMKHLFERGGKGRSAYQQMFDVFDGLGAYESKTKAGVSSKKELEEQKNNTKTKAVENYSSLAQRAIVFQEFAPALHKIFSFCEDIPGNSRKSKTS